MTVYLADTHIILWAAAEPDRLAPQVRALFDEDAEIAYSSVSIAEMAIKQSVGKLKLPISATEHCDQLALRPMPLTPAQAEGVTGLPLIHRDPFDRLLIAQALADDLTLVTADPRILRYPDVKLLANAA